MNFAAALPWATQTTYIPEDRSLGVEGEDLRERLDAAAKPASADETDAIIGKLFEIVAPADRGREIWLRVFDALLQPADGHGATVAVSVFTKTLQFMVALPSELPLPIVVVESEEEIGLDWDENDQQVVSLTIDNSDHVGFSALFGQEPIYGKVACVDELPQRLHDILARLYPSAQLR